MASPRNLPIVLYHYDLSPYARRLRWYLNLRKIPHSQCIQPRILPRPDLSSLLGVNYRRIPILAIGKDVYLDTRLIIQKLETLFPPSAAHPGISGAAAGKPEHTALEQLISQRVIEGDLFSRAIQCFPASRFGADAALLRDRTALFTGVDPTKSSAAAAEGTSNDDKTEESGKSKSKSESSAPSPLSPEVMNQQRPAALSVMRRWIRWLEDGLLADGRDWILDSNDHGPSLADLEATWVLQWVSPALPREILGAESAPRVATWVQRFKNAVKAAEEGTPEPPSLTGEEAAKLLLSSSFAEPEGDVARRSGDPGLVKGQSVRMWPTDYGFSHKDAGKLVAVDEKEYVIESSGAMGSVRIHAPKYGFTISADEGHVPSQL